jgi:DNA-binding MarR family transcriptional regulator
MDIFRELFFMQQTWSTLFSVTNKLQAASDRYLENLTMRQVMVMVAIVHLPADRATLNNIARKLGTTKQSVKQLITAMEKKRYVATVPSSKDRRAVNVHITETGRKELLSCTEISLEYFADIFSDFSMEEMESLWGLLKKLYRFDGEEQDGFEEEAPFGTEDGLTDSQLRAIEKFRRRRSRDEDSAGG